MGYVPKFKYDIFISYAHVDNDPLFKDERGWVDFFVVCLQQRLRVVLGEEVEIFRDPLLNHYEKFPNQLREALTQSAVMISILSPRYVKSEWCLRELSEFQRHTGGGRMVKVSRQKFFEK